MSANMNTATDKDLNSLEQHPEQNRRAGPFRFDLDPMVSQGEQLYAYLHLPKPGLSTEHGVVLCNPFGQEAVRAHRLYRVLAERLTRAGIACLRFDYRGTGDSDGQDDALTADTCIEDILAADRELRSQAQCKFVSWFGLRFGASMAALASSKSALRPDRLFLWDPIEAGDSWLTELKSDHAQALADLELPHSEILTPRNLGGHSSAAFESQGFLVSKALDQMMNAFSLESYLSLRCTRLICLAAGVQQQAQIARLDAARHILSFDMHLVGQAHWNSDEAMNTAIVPNDVIEAVRREMVGG